MHPRAPGRANRRIVHPRRLDDHGIVDAVAHPQGHVRDSSLNRLERPRFDDVGHPGDSLELLIAPGERFDPRPRVRGAEERAKGPSHQRMRVVDDASRREHRLAPLRVLRFAAHDVVHPLGDRDARRSEAVGEGEERVQVHLPRAGEITDPLGPLGEEHRGAQRVNGDAPARRPDDAGCLYR